jgi:membrane-associated protease RseP (regulator of RpoE activity)
MPSTSVTNGWGVGGPSRSYVARAGQIGIGTIKVPRPVASLSIARHGAFNDASYQCNVGSGLLKRFVATFDYGGQTLYLKPTSNSDPDIGAMDRVGLWLNLAKGGLRVMDVALGGPADQAGLKVGDLLTDIDGKRVLEGPLSEVRRSLRLMPVGVPLVVSARRDGVASTLTVIPRDLIPQ